MEAEKFPAACPACGSERTAVNGDLATYACELVLYRAVPGGLRVEGGRTPACYEHQIKQLEAVVTTARQLADDMNELLQPA